MAKKGGRNFTKENAAEAGRKGGIKSAESRRKKAELRTLVQIMLDSEVGKHEDGSPITAAEAMAMKIVQEAIKGDWRAWEIARDTAGQKPVEKIAAVGVDSTVVAEVEKAVSEAKAEIEDEEKLQIEQKESEP